MNPWFVLGLVVGLIVAPALTLAMGWLSTRIIDAAETHERDVRRRFAEGCCSDIELDEAA